MAEQRKTERMGKLDPRAPGSPLPPVRAPAPPRERKISETQPMISPSSSDGGS
jgi:hypothetical protein